MEEYLKAIYNAVMSYDGDEVKKLVSQALEKGADPVTVMNESLSKAIVEIGDKFGREEIFLMELMIAAEACMGGMDIVKSKFLENKVSVMKPKGIIVIGTVQGDIHNIGKDIVKTLLEAAGFEVHDIGVDQPAENFVKKALEVNAKIVASSALLTTSCPNQKAIEDRMREAGLKEKVKTIIGGAATSPAWGEEIGCDYYASTATEGVKFIKSYFEGAHNES
jgi:trimethylamine corrinoid protein